MWVLSVYDQIYSILKLCLWLVFVSKVVVKLFSLPNNVRRSNLKNSSKQFVNKKLSNSVEILFKSHYFGTEKISKHPRLCRGKVGKAIQHFSRCSILACITSTLLNSPMHLSTDFFSNLWLKFILILYVFEHSQVDVF